MLASNSVVVMPVPRCESWACEGELRPFVHYVPVREDLADLAAVHDWCRGHPGDCARIAAEGRDFITRFLNPARERAVALAVLRVYLDKARFRLDFGPWERVRQALERRLRPG
jgi:hypothetical protein